MPTFFFLLKFYVKRVYNYVGGMYMKIGIASDHRGYKAKEKLKKY